MGKGQGRLEDRLEGVLDDEVEVEGRLEVQLCKQGLACRLGVVVVVVDMLGRADRTVKVSQWAQV